MKTHQGNIVNCGNTTEVGNDYVVNKLIQEAKAAALMEDARDRMAMIYKDRGVKLRDAELKVSNQKMSLDAKDAEIKRLNEKAINITSLCLDAGVSHENHPPVQNVFDLVKAYQAKDIEIERLKDINKTNERLIDKFFAGYDGDLQGQHMLDSLNTLFNIIRQKSQGNTDLIDAGSALRATIKELRAEANHFNEKSVVAELKYDRLVSLIKRESCDISLILGVHRDNEKKLKASKVK